MKDEISYGILAASRTDTTAESISMPDRQREKPFFGVVPKARSHDEDKYSPHEVLVVLFCKAKPEEGRQGFFGNPSISA
jgi:hypothetical protein